MKLTLLITATTILLTACEGVKHGDLTKAEAVCEKDGGVYELSLPTSNMQGAVTCKNLRTYTVAWVDWNTGEQQ